MNRDEIPSDAPPSGRVSAWLSEIEKGHYRDDMDKYDKRCEVIRKRYRYEGSAIVRTREYQLLWSNIETMKSAVYSKPPHGTVSRRYRDADPVGRVACEVLERAINFSFDASDFDGVFKQVRDDFLLYARGVGRIYYEPEYETEDDLNEEIEDAEDTARARPSNGLRGISGDNSTLDGDSGSGGDIHAASDDAGSGVEPSRNGDSGTEDREPALKFENVRIRFVQRSDFRHQAARTWEEVQWVAFRAFLTRAEVTKRFGAKIGDQISLDSNPVDVEENERPASTAGESGGSKATIWEIWDKAKNNVLWIAKSWPDVLEEGKPYLVLDGFYPCPRPAYGTLTPDSLVPVPDYIFYQDQAEEINQLTARIGGLSDALKLVGFYPAGPQGEGSPEVEKAMSSGFENKLIAVQSWDSFRSGGSNGGPPIIWVPIEQVASVLEACVKLRQQLLEDVYQIIGISDIMRGATDPQETEGAQQLKAQYGGTRIRDRQQEIARFCRDIARLCGQVIAMYCSPATVEKMTNVKLPTAQDVLMSRLKWQAQLQQAQQLAMMQGMQNGQANGFGGMGPNSEPQSGAIQGGAPQLPGTNGIGTAPPTQSLAGAPPDLGPTQEDVFGLLHDSLSRRFKTDIENDSTIAGDESQERQDRTQFIESVTKFMETWGPMVIQKPELAPLASQLLLFGVRSFRVGRELEEVIEETAENLTQAGSMPKPPDPKVQAEQVRLQGTQAKTQAEIGKSQLDGQTAQQAAQAKMQEIQVGSAAKVAELRMKLAAAEQAHQHKMTQAQMEHDASMDKMALESQKQQTASIAQAAKPPTWPVNESGF